MGKSTGSCDIGMVGLGVMGRNLLLNMADHGFNVAGYDKDADKVAQLAQESAAHTVHAANDIKDFIAQLRQPRAIMLLVPAGDAVDAVIQQLLPLLDPGDLIIDAGNSYFKDTDVRSQQLSTQRIHFMGVGISGGEEGARHGPSIMPGGAVDAYERVRPVLEAVAARINNEPCVAYLGSGSAGHFVKMVHNGIEYGLMQLIAESYDLMKRGLGLSNDALQQIYTEWNQGELNSFLIEITGHIFAKGDEKTNKPLIDQILGVARQKGTGLWTSETAMQLQVPTPTIDAAVMMRDMSVLTQERAQASKIGTMTKNVFSGDKNQFIVDLQHAMYAATLLTYAQGMAVLSVASQKNAYQLDLATVARIWRGGCIIRATLLDNIYAAFRDNNDLPNLLLCQPIAQLVLDRRAHLCRVISQGAALGIPVPGLMSALSYFDAYCSAWLPANLIQAQRDYFGAHTYERVDAQGTFHTQW